MNRAAEVGPSTHRWWLDWRGECVAVVASGPSAKQVDLSLLRDRIHVIAIKATWELCPWSDVVYGCDAAWWQSKNGLPEYRGTKITYGMQAANAYRDLVRVDVKHEDKMLVETPGVIGSGGNSGFQAVNLAVQFGATSIILVGFDMTDRSGKNHWYGRNNWRNANNPDSLNFQRWLKAFNLALPQLRSLGVEVVNASADTVLEVFPRESLVEVMRRWGL